MPADSTDRLAIIDLGTNTFHLLILDPSEGARFTPLERYKQPVKLGEGGIENAHIAPAAFERGLDALRKFRQILEAHRIESPLAFATSAIREADNGLEFVRAAREETGIEVRTINGYEEAALIYEGVRTGIQLPLQHNVLLCDIGGGSVEFIVGDRHLPKLLESENIGAARLLEEIGLPDPLTNDQRERVERRLDAALSELFPRLKRFNLATLVGSSGTFETLGEMIALRQGDERAASNPNNFTFTRQQFNQVFDELIHATREQRRAMPAIEEVRVDMIVTGALLVNRLLRELDLTEIRVSTHALKEGMLARYLSTHSRGVDTVSPRQVREDAVRELARKFDAPAKHAELVSTLALSLFDQTNALHGYGAESRELLHYAALLTDIGAYINRSSRHKHAQYIINHSQMRGFSSRELLLLSSIVRYHRKSQPSKEHMHYNLLAGTEKGMVWLLGGMLRLAKNLDRAQRGVVTGLSVHPAKKKLQLQILSNDALKIERKSAEEEKEMLENALGRAVELSVNT